MANTPFQTALIQAAEKMKAEAQAARYRDDPVLWAEERLGLVLWSKQKEILWSIAKNKRTAVKSCHSIGKTFISAVASCWWIDTRDNCMVQSTAPTYTQVHTLLWEEIRKLHNEHNLTGRALGSDEYKRHRVNPETGRVVDTVVGEGKKPADGNIHGFHGTHRPDGVFVVIDEGCGVVQAIYTGAEAITTASFDRTLAVGNPDDPNTEFGEIFSSPKLMEKWNRITVSAFDTPNFTGEAALLRKKYRGDPVKYAMVEALLKGMPQPEMIAEQADLWGEDSPRYLSKVLATFPLTSVDSLFSAASIATGLSNRIEPESTAFRVLAVDPARYGGDNATIVMNVAGKIEVVKSFPTNDIMELAAHVHKYALELKIDQVRVDGIGVGGGVVDRLVQLTKSENNPYVVVEMTASGRAIDPTKFQNARAYWYSTSEYQLRNGLVDLPEHDQLLKELGGIRYEYTNGRMKIESKEDIRRSGRSSPDFVDAMVMALAPISYIENDPLASARPGQIHQIDVLWNIDTVSLY